MKNILLSVVLMFVFAGVLFAQGNYDYSAQQKFVPKDLGKVYLGMTLREFADEIAMGRAEVNSIQFEWLEFTVPVDGKVVESVRVRVHGLSREEKALMLVSESASDDDEEVDRLLVSRIPNHGVVYAMYVTFREDFKLKKYLSKTFGAGEDRKPDDENHLYDTQWNKKTSDGLDWLIRSFHLDGKRELQLLGRIPGTEWGITDN